MIESNYSDTAAPPLVPFSIISLILVHYCIGNICTFWVVGVMVLCLILFFGSFFYRHDFGADLVFFECHTRWLGLLQVSRVFDCLSSPFRAYHFELFLLLTRKLSYSKQSKIWYQQVKSPMETLFLPDDNFCSSFFLRLIFNFSLCSNDLSSNYSMYVFRLISRRWDFQIL